MWGTQLCFVYLSSNKSLRKLPDFSNCSELQYVIVEGCSSAVEPIRFHNCSSLRALGLLGNDVPEVHSIQASPKHKAVRLAWKSTHENLPLLDSLPCLSTLQINGPSDVPFDQIDYISPLLGEKQFSKHHLNHRPCELSGGEALKSLHEVELTCIPSGTLPVIGGSSLQRFTLSGYLLSKSVDFSAFPNLQSLKIRWTNVEEVCGSDHLTNLRYLDCSYCFRLRKVPDLRPSSNLRAAFFVLCPKMQGIPRLPLEFIRSVSNDVGSDDELRAILAALAFVDTTARALLTPGIHAGEGGSIRSQLHGRWAIHVWVTCDGCRMFPILGKRYKAEPVATLYSLCSKCFSKTCCCSERRKSRWKAEGKLKVHYDLCSSCYAKSGCDSLDFYEIDETCLPEQGPKPKVTLFQDGSDLGISVSGVSRRSPNDTDRFAFGSVFTLKAIKE